MEEHRVYVSLLAIMADKRKSQASNDYYQLLVTDCNTIPTRQVKNIDKSVGTSLMLLFNEHLNVAYDWPLKYIGDVRKNGGAIEITYVCKMPAVDGAIKAGKTVNLREFEMEDYYARIISGNASEYFR